MAEVTSAILDPRGLRGQSNNEELGALHCHYDDIKVALSRDREPKSQETKQR